MRNPVLFRSCLMLLTAVSVAALGACSTAPATRGEVAASAAPQQRWSEDKLIQQNQLLPNGLRPLRYFYW